MWGSFNREWKVIHFICTQFEAFFSKYSSFFFRVRTFHLAGEKTIAQKCDKGAQSAHNVVPGIWSCWSSMYESLVFAGSGSTLWASTGFTSLALTHACPCLSFPSIGITYSGSMLASIGSGGEVVDIDEDDGPEFGEVRVVKDPIHDQSGYPIILPT